MPPRLARHLEGVSPKAGLLALLVSLTSFAGCTDTSLIYNSQKYLSGTKGYVDHIAGTNLPTVIHGNPSAFPKADFDRIVRDDLKGSNWGRPTTFVAPPDNAPDAGYSMVLVFNGAVVGQLQVCTGAISGGGGGVGANGRIELTAAFCSGDRPVSVLAGGIGGVTDPNDPRFRDFLRQVGMVLFNPNNPEDNPDKDVNMPVP
jgi:hypothetical protein